jgi:hypothetical protein
MPIAYFRFGRKAADERTAGIVETADAHARTCRLCCRPIQAIGLRPALQEGTPLPAVARGNSWGGANCMRCFSPVSCAPGETPALPNVCVD